MNRLLAITALTLATAPPALAQPADPHAGHDMSMPMTMPEQASPADPHAGHAMPDEPAPEESSAPTDEPPPIPADHDADRYFPPATMAAARHQLAHEHGGMAWSKVEIDKLEWRPDSGADGYAWEGGASFGGDINRLVVASRGEGDRKLHEAEVDVLYSRAVTPSFNLEAGLRQDFEPRARTHLTVGLAGVAPYGFELDNAVFVSDRGVVTARLEAAHDLRLTQRVILEPRAEANLSAQDIPALRIGSGLSSLELGLRLRFAIQPQFAPYVGVNYERRFGATARLARAAGEETDDARVVVGLRSWF
jgi:copper resistance protein B